MNKHICYVNGLKFPLNGNVKKKQIRLSFKEPALLSQLLKTDKWVFSSLIHSSDD